MKTKLLYLERIAVGFLIFSATGVSSFARSSMTWETLVMPLLLCILAVSISVRYSLKISRTFVLLIISYLILFLCQLLYYGSFHPKHLVLYPLNMWVGYCFVRAMQDRFLIHVEFIITFFAGISLGIWVIDLITDGTVRHLLSGIYLGNPYNEIIDSYIILQTFINEGVDSILPRNSGFAWEPGAFAVFCCLALLINIYRNNFKIKQNPNATILIAAILSSQSTTGYSILFIFLIFTIWRKISGANRFIAMPVVITILTASVLSLPFMVDKIKNLLEEDLNELTISAAAEWNADKPIAAQRFLSFQIDFSDFLNNPWLGYGGRDSEMLVQRESLNIVTISGIGKIMAKFGVLGIGFFVYATILSSAWFSRYFQVRSPVILTLYILMVSISYSLIEHPLFISLWAYAIFIKPKFEITNKINNLNLSRHA